MVYLFKVLFVLSTNYPTLFCGEIKMQYDKSKALTGTAYSRLHASKSSVVLTFMAHFESSFMLIFF